MSFFVFCSYKYIYYHRFFVTIWSIHTLVYIFVSFFFSCYIFVRCSLHILLLLLLLYLKHFTLVISFYFSISKLSMFFFSISGRLNYLNLVEVYKNFFFSRENIFRFSTNFRCNKVVDVVCFFFKANQCLDKEFEPLFFGFSAFFKFLNDYYFHYSSILLLL